MRSQFFFLGLLLSSSVLAQSGADALLNATGSTDAGLISHEKEEPSEFDHRFKLTDPFLQSLFVEWKSGNKNSFELNRWVSLILSHDFKGASHLWSSVRKNLPDSFSPTAYLAWAYLTYRLDLPQTFLGAWKEAESKSKGTRPWLAFEQTLKVENVSDWIVKNLPLIDQAASGELVEAKDGFSLELAGWALRNDPAHAASVLAKLPSGNPLILPLSTTAVLNYARNGKLGDAGVILKRRVEPELKNLKNPLLLSKHYLALGRLLYQSGALEASEAFYSKVPRGVPEFIPARAERTWGLLRLGRVSELRGELESLSNSILSDRFIPEVSLVRSISHLKLCRYDEVAKDFKFFVDSHQVWAKKISSALDASETPMPDQDDLRINEISTGMKLRNDEMKRLQLLSEESIRAALPAIGVQPHWSEALASVKEDIQLAQKSLALEKRRFWKNRETVLNETIRKMKFVKIEAMSQLRTLAAQKTNQDVVGSVQSAPSKQSWPFEGVYWPDELFTYKANVHSLCPGGKK
jgi:hypothetical protein